MPHFTEAAAAPETRPKRALLAWEFGAGRTHVAHLLGVAAHLRADGVECLAALYDMQFAQEFAALGIPAVQNYVWPARRRAPFGWQERPVRGLGDVLANLGFATPEALGSALAHYDGLFALFEPDIVLCENAHGAMLAARGRRPVVAFGNPACLPPVIGCGFALYPGGDGQPSWPQEFVTAQINKGLAAAGRQQLASLSELLRIDGIYPFGPVELDIYSAQRTAPMLPSYVPELQRPVPIGVGNEIFAYLHGFVQHSEALMAGLAAIDRPMRLYLPGLATEARDKFPPSCQLEPRAVPLGDILERSRCVVHHGGPQLTSICLAAGLPQVILTKELDNESCGGFVAARGLGMARAANEASADWLVAAARRAYDDADLKRRCETVAGEFAGWLEEDPARIVADAALALIGAPSRGDAQ